MNKIKPKKVSIDVIKTFYVMGRCKNLSKAAEELGVTRQTVRRHIELAEEATGKKLLYLHKRTYELTDAGAAALKDAEIIVERSADWLRGTYGVTKRDEAIHIDSDSGLPMFYSQRHPLMRMWADGTALIRKSMKTWVEACGLIEDSKFVTIRPYVLIFRKQRNEWLCVEIGERCAFALWYGWEWAKSSVGLHITEIPAGELYSEYISDAYDDVLISGTPRLDHQFRHISKIPGGDLLPMSVQRLLLPCRFPNGEMALASIVDFTNDVEINGLDNKYLKNYC